MESKAVLRDISRVQENPNVGNPLPDIYRQAPQRLEVADGVKLFYFTKYLPAGDLTYTNKDKALEKKTHGFGGTIRDLGFKVSTNPSTNQLIIHCADQAECNQVLEYLKKTDVPPIQVHVDCLILERFGDLTKDWETTLMIEGLFGNDLTLGEAKYPNPAFPGASLRESRRGDFGLDFGFWHNEGVSGDQIRAVVDVLESRGYLKILLNPTLETVNGKEAFVRINDRAPIEKTVTERGNQVYTVTDYQDVSDTLTVTPYVYADGFIGLKTSIKIGSKSKPEGVVQSPIVTERSIDVEENRIAPGKSLVIGGMRKAENRSVIRGVPFFKDLPLIGILFSSKDFEEKANEIIFVLTPSISSGGRDYEGIADMVREKFGTPDYESEIEERVTDPLGTRVYTDLIERQAETAETEMVRLQIRAAQARRQAHAERLRAERALATSQAMQARAEKAQAEITQTEARKNLAEAENAAILLELQAQQALATTATDEMQAADFKLAAARANAQQAQRELQAAEQKVEEFNQQLDEAQRQADRIQQELNALEASETDLDINEAGRDPNDPSPMTK